MPLKGFRCNAVEAFVMLLEVFQWYAVEAFEMPLKGFRCNAVEALVMLFEVFWYV
jgi:hypothetical protein